MMMDDPVLQSTLSPKITRKKRKKKRPTSGSIVARRAREKQMQSILSRSTTNGRPSTAGSSNTYNSRNTSSVLQKQLQNKNYRPTSAGPVRAVAYNYGNNTNDNRKQSMPVTALANMSNNIDQQQQLQTRLKRRRRKRPSTAGGTRTSKALSSTGKQLFSSNNTNINKRPSFSPQGKKKRPKSAANIRKSASSGLISYSNRRGYENDENDVRTSFPPVKTTGRKATQVNTWMNTSLQEDIPSYSALKDRYCPLYKPKNLIKGKAGQPSPNSTKYKMKKWREKYNNDLRESIGKAMNMESPGIVTAKKKSKRKERGDNGEVQSERVASDMFVEEASFPFPDTTEENSLMFQPTNSTAGVFHGSSALISSESGYKGSNSTTNLPTNESTVSNITFAKTPKSTLDPATRNRIRNGNTSHGIYLNNPINTTSSTSNGATSHGQDEIQVVKSILHRERLVQMLKNAICNNIDNSSNVVGGRGGIQLDYPKIFSLLDRIRIATVETIEAIQTWHTSEQEQGSFIWHTQNYLMELLVSM